jgi:hypothetical protein
MGNSFLHIDLFLSMVLFGIDTTILTKSGSSADRVLPAGSSDPSLPFQIPERS